MRKLGDLRGLGIVHGHAQNHQAIPAILLLQIDKPRHLDLARRTPGRPEVQQHGLAPKVRKLYPSAIQCGQLEVGRWNVVYVANQFDGAVFPAAIEVFAGSQHTHDDHHQHYENNGIAFQHELPLEREPVQERQIAGKQFQIIKKNKHADGDQQHSADHFNGMQMTAKAAVECQKPVHSQRG